MNTKVTIIMATFNRAHLIEETLLSIKNQTYIDFECLIIDDGSKDNSEQVITNFIQKDSRFLYYKRPNNYLKGLPGCRNFGLDTATGDFIIFFDDDDIVHPQNLEVTTNTLQDKNIDFCFYQKKSFENEKFKFDELKIINKQKFGIEKLFEVLQNKIGFASCTVLWKRNVFSKIRFFEILQYAEEWECYSRILTENFKGIQIDQVLYYNRKHQHSNTNQFYSKNPLREKSKAEAIFLVVKNLKDKKLLSNKLFAYLIFLSLQFREYDLFQRFFSELNFNYFEKIKWNFYYKILPLKLMFYRWRTN